jgi:hypothetical protein
MTITQDPIILHTVRDSRTLGCPLCGFTVDVPPVPVSDALGAVFGMSGETLARVHGEQSLKQVSRTMEQHLRDHPIADWLRAVVKVEGTVVCSLCRRPRTPLDTLDYDPVQVITGAPLGWSSDADGEVCGACMEKTIRGGQG